MHPLFHSFRRYTRFVAVWKRLLWLIAIALLTTIVIVATRNAGDEGARLIFSGVTTQKDAKGAETAVMMKPRYQGMDSQNRPFTVTAERAVQESTESVLLYEINADVTLKHEEWMALSADKGRYSMTDKTLDLADNIHLFYEGGYEFRTHRAFINVNQGTAIGNTAVVGQGPTGALRANSFKILDRGEILRFNDAVKVTLYL